MSEDPSVAQFVRSYAPDGMSSPATTEDGRLIHDDQQGSLCTFKTGTVWIDLVSGTHRARMQVHITPGMGPCLARPVVDEFVPPPDKDPVPKQRPAPTPTTIPPKAKPIVHPPPPVQPVATPAPPPQQTAQPAVPKPAPLVKPFLAPNPVPEPAPVLLPPAPSMIPSPAPPASASAAGAEKEEDKEVETESAAWRHSDHSLPFDPVLGWASMGAAALLGLLGAGTAALYRSRPRPQWAQADIRRGRDRPQPGGGGRAWE